MENRSQCSKANFKLTVGKFNKRYMKKLWEYWTLSRNPEKLSK